MHITKVEIRTKMNSTYLPNVWSYLLSLSLNFECHIGSVFIKYLSWYVTTSFQTFVSIFIHPSHHHSNNVWFFLAKNPISVVFWQRISPNLLRILAWIYFAEQSLHQDWFLKIVEHHWNTLWRSSVSWSNTYIRNNSLVLKFSSLEFTNFILKFKFSFHFIFMLEVD